MKSTLKFALLLSLSVLLTVTTFVFGALPMRALWRSYGRRVFWASLVLVAIAFGALVSMAYGLLIMALAVSVGVYGEVEEHQGAVFTSGFVAILAAIGTSVLALGSWVQRTKGHLLEEIRNQLTPLVDRLSAMNPNATISVDNLLQQLPSGFVIGLIMALAIALIAEKRFMSWLALPFARQTSDGAGNSVTAKSAFGLATYRAPDVFIWLAIAAIFGSFYKHGHEALEVVAINALNVLVVVFFFQGIAIVSQAFRVYKLSSFWQSMWYFVLIVQLFLLVSLLGFADFWLDFRKRLVRKPAEPKKIF